MYYSDPDIRFVTYSFTGHEHLDDFDLINMNGRMYDPLLAMFLSPDNFVQSPGNTQNLNRYAYCLNNPLIYTDPDGESLVLLAAIIGGWMGMGQAIINSDKQGWGLVGDMAKGLFVGAATGAAGAWAGGAAVGALFSQPVSTFGGFVAQGAVGGFTGGGTSGFVNGIGNACISGSSLNQVISTGFNGLITGSIAGGISGALFGMLQYAYEKGHFMAIARNNELTSNPNTKLTPSSETLNEFSDKYYPDYKFRDKSNLIYKKGYVESINSEWGAYTDPKMVNGRYNVYFAESSFSSPFNLYLNMGHEYIHVAQLLTINNYISQYSEYSAYRWNNRVSHNSFYNSKALEYFDPNSSFNNSIIYNKIVKPIYMNVAQYGIYDVIPRGLS